MAEADDAAEVVASTGSEETAEVEAAAGVDGSSSPDSAATQEENRRTMATAMIMGSLFLCFLGPVGAEWPSRFPDWLDGGA